jgi:hypothetical protein
MISFKALSQSCVIENLDYSFLSVIASSEEYSFACHCERPKGAWQSHKKRLGLPRRYAPRNDSSRLGLPRRYAPRNDMGSNNFGTYPILN